MSCSHMGHHAEVRSYNIRANLIRTVEQRCDKATSAVQMNGNVGDWFRPTVGVRQGCLLLPTLFNIFLERMAFDALEEHDGNVSIGGRNITRLRFADDTHAQPVSSFALTRSKRIKSQNARNYIGQPRFL